MAVLPAGVQVKCSEVGEGLDHRGQAGQEPAVVVEQPQEPFEGGLVRGGGEGGEFCGVSGERADAGLQDVVSKEVDGGAEEHQLRWVED